VSLKDSSRDGSICTNGFGDRRVPRRDDRGSESRFCETLSSEMPSVGPHSSAYSDKRHCVYVKKEITAKSTEWSTESSTRERATRVLMTEQPGDSRFASALWHFIHLVYHSSPRRVVRECVVYACGQEEVVYV
jgi:hypothetical protein